MKTISYLLLTPAEAIYSALTDISKSIAFYLHDEESLHRVLAIDLCSKGFHIWQHYVDAMELLRALFSLATNSRKDSISAQNAGPQARLAVLQIATNNTALFMTTLALDILNPRNVDDRKSVMQIFAFLIRKVRRLLSTRSVPNITQKPLVLYPNLPRLMEAVVKSLDPNSTSNREAVLDAATDIIGQVVKTYVLLRISWPILKNHADSRLWTSTLPVKGWPSEQAKGLWSCMTLKLQLVSTFWMDTRCGQQLAAFLQMGGG